MSRPKSYPVPHWVRSAVCLTASASVPGMLIATAMGANLHWGVTSAIALFAVSSARLAFNVAESSGRTKQPDATLEARC